MLKLGAVWTLGWTLTGSGTMSVSYGADLFDAKTGGPSGYFKTISEFRWCSMFGVGHRELAALEVSVSVSNENSEHVSKVRFIVGEGRFNERRPESGGKTRPVVASQGIFMSGLEAPLLSERRPE